MKALVTGGTGFLGSHLVEILAKKNIQAKCLVRNPKKIRWLEGMDAEIISGDCSCADTLESAVKGVDYVFHLAGLVRGLTIGELYEANAGGTAKLAAAAARINPKIKKFLYVSSQAAAGPSENKTPLDENSAANPVSHYGFSKLLGEIEAKKYGSVFPVTILRPPSIYGPRDRDVFAFFEYVKKGYFPLPKDDRYINISYAADIAEGIVSAALSEKSAGKTYFIGDDTVYSWEGLADILIRTVNPKAKKMRVSKAVFVLSAVAGELNSKFNKKPAVVSFDKLKELGQKYWLFSSGAAKRDFGYETKIPLEKGIEITYDWYLRKGWL